MSGICRLPGMLFTINVLLLMILRVSFSCIILLDKYLLGTSDVRHCAKCTKMS